MVGRGRPLSRFVREESGGGWFLRIGVQDGAFLQNGLASEWLQSGCLRWAELERVETENPK